VIVAGAAAVDITAQVSSNDHGKQSTSPGTVSISLGGVGRNIAEAAHRASSGLQDEKKGSVLLVSAIGNDPFARLLSDEMTRLDMRTDGLVSMDGSKTAVCNMLLNAEGDLMNGVAAMDVVEQLPGDKVRIPCLQLVT
jgi:pseudouridine-5'-phosphate glycosidase/pseudouridine kinase